MGTLSFQYEPGQCSYMSQKGAKALVSPTFAGAGDVSVKTPTLNVSSATGRQTMSARDDAAARSTRSLYVQNILNPAQSDDREDRHF
jgi:hypothetical protein